MPSSPALTKRACDTCRLRKIKCDGVLPCSTCRISNLTCRYNVAPRKRGPKTSHAASSDSVTSFAPDRGVTSHDSASPVSVGSFGQIGTEPNQYTKNSCSNGSVQRALQIERTFITALQALVPAISMTSIVDTCITGYLQYSFPAGPICHEVTLRHDNSRFFGQSDGFGWSQEFLAQAGEQGKLNLMRSFTLLTALCSAATSLLHRQVLPSWAAETSGLFYRASRDMFGLIEDWDVEAPNSSSITIRLFYSITLQHAAGKSVLANHVAGHARLLAQDMRLYDEHVLVKYDPLEAQLLRNNFWQLWISDQSATALDSRPFNLHESVFDARLSLNDYGREPLPLLDQNSPYHQPPYEERVLSVFHFSKRMRRLAAQIVQGIRFHDRQSNHAEESTSRLAEMYLEYCYFLDSMPPWLQSPKDFVTQAAGSNEHLANEVESYQIDAFRTQWVHIVMSFHCFRMVILHQCIKHGLPVIMGLNDQPLTLAMKEAEIARDFVQTIKAVPIRYLLVIGEPCVEQLRRVGSILLELEHKVENSTIKERAGAYLASLLDVLSTMDSRVTDQLIGKDN